MNTPLIQLLQTLKNKALSDIAHSLSDDALLISQLLGPKSEFGKIASRISNLTQDEKQKTGIAINEYKREILDAIQSRRPRDTTENEWLDVTAPGIRPPK